MEREENVIRGGGSREILSGAERLAARGGDGANESPVRLGAEERMQADHTQL
jgi:hypothetical protein